MKGLIGHKTPNVALQLHDKNGKELVYADMDTLKKRYGDSYDLHVFVLPNGKVLDVEGDYKMWHEEFADKLFEDDKNQEQFKNICKMCNIAKQTIRGNGITEYLPVIDYPQMTDMLVHYYGWVRIYQSHSLYGENPADCIIDVPSPALFGVDYTPEQEKTIKDLYTTGGVIKDDEWKYICQTREKLLRNFFVDLFDEINAKVR